MDAPLRTEISGADQEEGGWEPTAPPQLLSLLRKQLTQQAVASGGWGLYTATPGTPVIIFCNVNCEHRPGQLLPASSR